MKNNTKIRLHLSKQLFESLTKQVIAEAKGKHSYGAGMEEVKMPKKKGKDKDMKSEALNVSKNATPSMVYNIGDFKKKLVDLSRQVSLMKGLDSGEIEALIALLDDVMEKVQKGSIANPLKTATKTFKAATGGVKEVEEMETRVAETSGMKKPLAEMTSGEFEFFSIGKWANELLKLGLESEGDLIQLGGNVLTAATLGTMGVATGLIMYGDKIKSGIKMAGAKLKSLVKGKDAGDVKEVESEDIVSKLSPETIAALKK